MDGLERRRVVQAVGGGLAVGLAGCLGNGNGNGGGSDGDDEGATDDTDSQSETDAEGSDGLLYAFSPDRIDIVDPDAGEVVDELTDGIDDVSWGDPRITPDELIFVPDTDRAQVLAIDTTTRAVADRIDVGPDPLHTYAPLEGEVWIHSDAEGRFYVIETETLTVVDTVDIVDGGHGKLLTHPDLGSTAYALNVTEPTAFVIDLEERSVVDEIEFGSVGGGHYKAYAPATGYAYLENSGTATMAVLDTETNELVDELEVAGAMYLSPEESLLSVLDGETVALIDATSEDSETLETVTVADEPSALRYYDDSEDLYGFTANTEAPTVTVLDLEEMEIVEEIDVGEIDGSRRAGVTGDGRFFTPADADGTVAIIDMDGRTLEAEVEVGAGVDTLQFVGDSGVGYTGF